MGSGKHLCKALLFDLRVQSAGVSFGVPCVILVPLISIEKKKRIKYNVYVLSDKSIIIIILIMI